MRLEHEREDPILFAQQRVILSLVCYNIPGILERIFKTEDNMPRQQHILRLTLPIPPSINEQYATVNGMRVSTVVARRFKQQVRQKLTALEREGKLGETLRAHLRQDYLALLLVFYFETPLKRDLDGGLKITQFSRVGALSGPAHPGRTWFHCL